MFLLMYPFISSSSPSLPGCRKTAINTSDTFLDKDCGWTCFLQIFLATFGFPANLDYCLNLTAGRYERQSRDRFEERFDRSEGPIKTRGRTTSPPSERYRFRNFAVQSRVWNCTDISNSNFASIRAKDAICDAVRDACDGHRPEPPEEGGSLADVPLFLSLYRDKAVLYRDLSGVSLHKRGYRDIMHKASLNEGIAAAVLTIAGWNQAIPGFGDANKNSVGTERVLLDPMCGSGTFLIEAALMASQVAPGLMRRQWPFQV